MIMENFKIPYVNSETLRTQRVENYLNDLKERLKQLCQQHDQVIENSLNIIHEINEVTASLCLEELKAKNNPNIKDLIKEFENVPAKGVVELNSATKLKPKMLNKDIGVKKILQSFKKIKESHVLRESLMLLKRTKGSLNKIETYLNEIVKETNSSRTETDVSKNSLNKIQVNLPQKSNKVEHVDLSQFLSCSNSEFSLQVFKSTENANTSKEQTYQDVTWSITDIGYQGDVDDSEYDLLTVTRKKKNID